MCSILQCRSPVHHKWGIVGGQNNKKYRKLDYALWLWNQAESTVISSGFSCTIHDTRVSSYVFLRIFYEL